MYELVLILLDMYLKSLTNGQKLKKGLALNFTFN